MGKTLMAVGAVIAVVAAWYMDHLGATVLAGLILIFVGAKAWSRWRRPMVALPGYDAERQRYAPRTDADGPIQRRR